MMLDRPAQADALDRAIATGPEVLRPILLAVRDIGCALAMVSQGTEAFALPPDLHPKKEPAAVVRPGGRKRSDDMANSFSDGGEGATARALVAAIHVAEVNGGAVCFYTLPNRGAELPWVSLDDLLKAIGLWRGDRRYCLRRMRARHPDELRTVATRGRLVVVASDRLARGLLAYFAGPDATLSPAEAEFAVAAAAAAKAVSTPMRCRDRLAFFADPPRKTSAGKEVAA